jgi:hypothetical protein
MRRIVAGLAGNDGQIRFRVGVLAKDQRQLLPQPPPSPERRSDRIFDQPERDRVRRIHRPLLQDDAVDQHRPPTLERASIAKAVEFGTRPA